MYYLKKIIYYFKLDFKIAIQFDFRVAFYDFLKNFIFRKNVGLGKKIYHRKYELIKRKLLNDQKNIIDKYKTLDFDDCKIEENCNIWCFWWQGLNDNTPDYVKLCFKSIEKYNKNHKLVIVTKDNISKYVNLPEIYYKKLNEGIISLTHFSDLLRVELLATYGGIWIDAAFFMNRQLDNKIYDYNFFTIKHGLLSDFHVCKGYWTDGFIMSSKGNLFFKYLKEMFEAYWNKYDFLVCYLLIDCYIALGYENIEQFKKMIDKVYYNNSDLFFFDEHGNDVYDAKEYKKIMEKTYVFRIHYKRHFNKTAPDNKLTNFGKLINDFEKDK